MKFLIDAHLPPSLCGLLQASGHAAIHTSQLPGQNRTSDQAINILSVREQWVVVSKDADFFHSHLLRQEPWKLLIVRTGNIGVGELKDLFFRNLPAIVAALESNTLIELDSADVRVVI